MISYKKKCTSVTKHNMKSWIQITMTYKNLYDMKINLTIKLI